MENRKLPQLTQSPVETANFAVEFTDAVLQFGKYANVGRAIPDVRDGLKPGARRILWSMWNQKARHFDNRVKAARAVGEVMGKYHPHGDSALYGTMVGMAQDFNMNAPFIDPQGNWGSPDFGAAAARYTECRLSVNASLMMGWLPGQDGVVTEIDEEAVDLVPNFSGDVMEPTILPSLFPNIVVNGVEGIGLGVATQAPGHNLKEVMSLAAYMVDQPNPRTETVMKHLPGPDFGTECDVYDTDDGGIERYITTGMGSYVMRARFEIEEYDNGTARKPQPGKRIIVVGLPHGVAPTAVMEGINGMIERKDLPGSISLTNLTDMNGTRIVLDIGPLDADDIIQRLLFSNSQSKLQINGSVYLNAVKDGYIQTVSIVDAILSWLEHRRKCIRRRSRFRLTKAKNRMHMVDGFIKTVPLAEEIVAVVRSSEDKAEASETMQSRWGFSAPQAEAILQLNIGQITKLGVDRYERERDQLQETIDWNTEIISTPEALNKQLKSEIRAVAKAAGRPRRAHIVEGSPRVNRPETPAVEEPAINGYLVQTGGGYVRWVQSNRITQQLESDHVVSIQSVTNQNMVECITDWGYHSRLPMDIIPKKMTSSKSIFSMFLDPGEKPVLVGSGAPHGFGSSVVMVGQSGLGKLMDWDVWATHRGNKAVQVFKDEPLKSAFFLPPEGKDVMILSRYGNALKLNPDNLTAKGRGAGANPYMKLNVNSDGELFNGEGVALAGAVGSDDTIVYVTDEGKLGKFTVASVRAGRRGGKGVVTNKSDTFVANAWVAGPDAESISWFHGTMSEPKSVKLSDIPDGLGLGDNDLVPAGAILKAAAVWIG